MSSKKERDYFLLILLLLSLRPIMETDSGLLFYLENTYIIFLLILRLLRYIHIATGSEPYLRIDFYNRIYRSFIK